MPQQPLAPKHDQSPVRVTVVESPGCHFCADAHQALDQFAISYPLDVNTVDACSDAGRLLMAQHRAAMSPLVLLDGVFFSHGRLPRRKLTKALTTRFGHPAATDTAAAGGGRRG